MATPADQRLSFEPIGLVDGLREGFLPRREWTANAEELVDLLDAMEQSSAIDGEGIPRAFFEGAGVTVSPAQLDHSLARLAADPPDFVPDQWTEWLSWLNLAAGSGGARSRTI